MTDAACEVWFDHRERATLEQVLPELLEKTLARGWRALVRLGDASRIEHVDSWLWTYRDDSFLPHGVAGEPLADRQPILISASGENVNGAQALFVLDGDPDSLDGYARCIVIFDGNDPERLAAARDLWRRAKSAGHAVTYWQQGENRGWERRG